MTINDLATRANVTVRTIRYYVEQGLLPPPEAGYPAEYAEEHLQRLALIRRLKEQYLPLEEIRAIMDNVSPAELEKVLDEQGPAPLREDSPAGAGPLNSAVDYITGILNWGNTRDQFRQQAPPAAAAPLPPQGKMRARANKAPPAPAQEQAEETIGRSAEGPAVWHRRVLAAGVELHYQASEDAAFNNMIERLISAAEGILAPVPEKTEKRR